MAITAIYGYIRLQNDRLVFGALRKQRKRFPRYRRISGSFDP